MPKSKSGPDPVATCACGRKLTEASAYTHRSSLAVYVYHRCDCGREWTDTQELSDRTQPVSTDEVIEVHKFLGDFRGALPDLIPSPKPPSA